MTGQGAFVSVNLFGNQKDQFYESATIVVSQIGEKEVVLIAGDLSEHVQGRTSVCLK